MLRNHRLRDGTAEGNHCQAAILQLRQALLALSLLILGEELGAQAVIARDLNGVPLEDLLGAAQLDNRDPEEDLEVRANGPVELVMCLDGNGAGLERVALARDADEVGHHEADPSEHGDAAMLQLCLPEVGNELRVLGEADGVELVLAPCPLRANEALSKLAVVKEGNARFLVGDREITACNLLSDDALRTGAAQERSANGGCCNCRHGSASSACGAALEGRLRRRRCSSECGGSPRLRGTWHEGRDQAEEEQGRSGGARGDRWDCGTSGHAGERGGGQ
mmetsp:Transcript_39381/g.83895  ORF Transcript_39381/g.83895 Transcript_39381/m.83895 type:complete len:279 (+) Transcript_39381:132-968(+)